MLETTATKREAKTYLSRFKIQDKAVQKLRPTSSKAESVGVNLGNLYLPVRAVDENPVFSTSTEILRLAEQAVPTLHIALVKIRALQSADEPTVRGVGQTLSQLTQLGLSCVVIIDPEDGKQRSSAEAAAIATQEVDRMAEAIEQYGHQSARRLDSVIEVHSIDEQSSPSVKIRGPVRITNQNLLLTPIQRGVIPVISPIGFISSNQKIITVDTDEAVLALTRAFAGLQTDEKVDKCVGEMTTFMTSQKGISLDRIIVLDPLGGIPSGDKVHDSHVFINLEQEFDSVMDDLLNSATPSSRDVISASSAAKGNAPISTTLDNSSSKSSDNQADTVGTMDSEPVSVAEINGRHSGTGFHEQNLRLIKNALALLPPSSSAFLTTPDAVARSQSRPPLAYQGPGVQTRRQRNPLIHNLLTDKPVFSSSLPSNRLPNLAALDSSPAITSSSSATFFKRGMPVSIAPDPLIQAWAPSLDSQSSINMADPRVDFSRLIYLIDDSFSRKLDVTHYLNRIQDRVAGVIIAGEYEGGAILTWETPPGIPVNDLSRKVPYLDKFAVLKRSQGAGGVADIVFKAMVRDCFPYGVCWRSRKDNPVNKWYFERAKGTWIIPESNWTMFWTTEGVNIGDQVFLDYQRVCRAVEPSWADDNNVID